ncbi:magnesium transporter [Neptunomonas japonica]|uniref:magnesium transporter n=1 Tax=Neptunomonas japonica TaxID=417574 RepID=UPI000419056A|nr:magnesium transporter [Neptunomonas japonica]
MVIGAVASWFSGFMIGLVIASAIAINIMTAAFSGVLIPVLLDKLKIDPRFQAQSY